MSMGIAEAKSIPVVATAGLTYAAFNTEEYVILFLSICAIAVCGALMGSKGYTSLIRAIKQVVAALIAGSSWMIFCEISNNQEWVVYAMLISLVITYKPQLIDRVLDILVAWTLRKIGVKADDS